MSEREISFVASLARGKNSVAFDNEGESTVKFSVPSRDLPQVLKLSLLTNKSFRVTVTVNVGE